MIFSSSAYPTPVLTCSPLCCLTLHSEGRSDSQGQLCSKHKGLQGKGRSPVVWAELHWWLFGYRSLILVKLGTLSLSLGFIHWVVILFRPSNCVQSGTNQKHEDKIVYVLVTSPVIPLGSYSEDCSASKTIPGQQQCIWFFFLLWQVELFKTTSYK